MAFPTTPTAGANTLLQSTTTTASTTHTFPSLTTLAPQAGDLIIAICVMYTGGTNNAEFSSWGASLTETRDDATTTANDLALGVAHKIASGSESGTFTVTSATAARSVNFLMRIPATTWHGTTIPEVLAAVRASGAVANPGSFNPANWDAEDTLWISVYAHSETSTTGSPPTIDTPPTNYTGQLIVARNADAVGHITAAVAFRQVNDSTQDVDAWTVSNALRGNGLASVVGIRPHPPITVDITHAAETDTAQALTFIQGTVSIGGPATETDLANEIIPLQPLPASETDSALALDYELASGGTHVDITHAAETDTAQTISASKFLTPALEIDTAQTISASKFLTPALETDTAVALVVTKPIVKTLTLVAETDTAQALSIASSNDYDIVHASETDTAQALDVDKAVTITRASETDFANEIVPFQVFPALETNSAQALTFQQEGQSISPATETDTAQALSYTGTYSISPALETDTVAGTYANKVLTPVTETDTAVALSAAGNKNITAATETDAAQPLNIDKALSVTHAAETDSAQPVTYSQAGSFDIAPALETDSARTLTKTNTIGPALETDAAQALSVTGPQSKTIVPVEETDSARTLVVTKPIVKGITFVAETDSAQALTASKGVNLTAAVSTNTAQSLDADKRVTIGFAEETDTAINLGVGGAFSTDTVAETNAALSLSYGILPPQGMILDTRTGRFTHVKPGRISRPREGALV